MSLNELIISYLATKQGSIKEPSYRALCKILWRFKNELPEDTNNIKISFLNEWKNDLSKRYSSGYARKILINFRAVLNLAQADELIAKNPFMLITIPSEKSRQIEPFTKEETRLILNLANGNLKDFLGIAFYTGMRICEILALTKEDIDLEKGHIKVTKSMFDNVLYYETKTGVDRVVPIFESALPFIKNRLKKNGNFLFSNKNKSHFFGSTSINQSFKRLLKVNHIKYRSLRHTRHTFATTMIKKAINDGFSIMWVSKILGHSSLQTTLRVYTRHIQDEHLKIDRQMQIF